MLYQNCASHTAEPFGNPVTVVDTLVKMSAERIKKEGLKSLFLVFCTLFIVRVLFLDRVHGPLE
jgi:hypothetical protein